MITDLSSNLAKRERLKIKRKTLKLQIESNGKILYWLKLYKLTINTQTNKTLNPNTRTLVHS